jgi:hypothetical protein
LIGVPDEEPFARAAGLNFVPFCENEYPTGSIAKLYSPVSKMHGLEVARWSIREVNCDLFSAASKHLPQKLAETGVEALVLDPIHAFLALVPMSLGMPYAQVWNLLHFDLSGATPPCVFSWPYESTPEALARNIEGVKAIGGPLPQSYLWLSLTPRKWVSRSIGMILLRLFPSWL